MVKGLDTFRKYFEKHEDQYVLIGGAACDIVFESNDPSFDGDCVLEEAVCCFSLTQEEKDKCRYTYNDNETYGFIMSNPYIMGLYCECESARADIAVNMEIKDDDPLYRKIMRLADINEVLFQCLLLDDIWENDGMICAKLYTVYVVA